MFPLLSAWVEDLKAMESGSRIRVAVLGLRYWSHNDHPCPLCRVNQVRLGEDSLNETTLDSLPFEDYTTDDYNKDVQESVKVPWIN